MIQKLQHAKNGVDVVSENRVKTKLRYIVIVGAVVYFS